MGLTRITSGLIHYNSFDTDIYDNGTIDSGNIYNKSNSSPLSSANGVIFYASTTGGVFVYPTSGAFCVSASAYKDAGISRSSGVILSDSPVCYNSADRDYYRLEFDNLVKWQLRRTLNGATTNLAGDSTTPDPAGGTWFPVRLWVSSGVKARYGATALSSYMSSNDTNFTESLYGGGSITTVNLVMDNLDIRTGVTVTCTGLPTGYYLKVSDGVTTAKAAESSGTATVDASAVLFPLALVTVYSGDPDAGGVLVTELDTGDYADMGGGDVFEYSSDGLITTCGFPLFHY